MDSHVVLAADPGIVCKLFDSFGGVLSRLKARNLLGRQGGGPRYCSSYGECSTSNTLPNEMGPTPQSAGTANTSCASSMESFMRFRFSMIRL